MVAMPADLMGRADQGVPGVTEQKTSILCNNGPDKNQAAIAP